MRYGGYKSKLGQLPLDIGKQCISEDSVVIVDNNLYKVSFILKQKTDKLKYNVADTLMLDNISGSDGLTLTYWTDYDKEITVLMDQQENSLKINSILKPEILMLPFEKLFPEINNQEFSDPVISQLQKLLLGKTIEQDKNINSVGYVAPKHSWPAVVPGQDKLVRMEMSTKTESKFWSIWIEQNNKIKVCYYYGKIGSNGTSGVYSDAIWGNSTANLAGAIAYLKEKVEEKQKKGYEYIQKGI